VDNIEYIAETLPLEIEYKPSQSIKNLENSNIQSTLWNTNLDKKVLFTQSAHTELINRPSTII
jgi:hypothetical protein